MHLSQTDLPSAIVAVLVDYNIREVEQLLSFAQAPSKLAALATALKIPLSRLTDLLEGLREKHANLYVPPADGPRYPTGHRPPRA